MKYTHITEGKARFFVPAGRIYDAEVFYNPVAQENRNISVCCAQVFQRMLGEPLNICDLLSASGASGLRYAKEVSGVKSVTLNDKNPSAAKLIKKNITLNKLAKTCKASHRDANALLSENIYNYVDVDPFGTPILYMDSAARGAFWHGMLAVTATDQAPLSGTYPNACLRKYGVRSMKTDYYAELGVRILITSIIRACARHEKSFVPHLSFATQHYFRVFGRIWHGAGEADKMLRQFGHVMHCFSCGNRRLGSAETRCSCGRDFTVAGPLYLGPLNDHEFVDSVKREMSKRGFPLELIQEISYEIDQPIYYDLHYLYKKTKVHPRKMEEILELLEDKGFVASRTHFCPTAIKTNASFEELKKLM